MAYPYIPTGYHGGAQSSVSRIVIHGTVSPTVQGGARAVARYFQSPSTGGSAHYVVDPGEIVQCVKEGTVAYHAPPNTGTIGIELCDPQKGSSSRWGDDGHEAMLRLAAKLVREVAARWKVPLKRLSVADLKAGRHGICGHVDVSNAFRMTDHGDPGPGFPWAHFMDLINQQEDDMQLSDNVPVGKTYDGDFAQEKYPLSFVLIGAMAEAKRAKAEAAAARKEVAALRGDLAEIKALLTAPKGQ